MNPEEHTDDARWEAIEHELRGVAELEDDVRATQTVLDLTMARLNEERERLWAEALEAIGAP